MTIQDIYNHYTILPSLQQHMLRVGAFTISILNSIRKSNISINEQSCISTALLHDLWNIVKFDMSLYPQLFEPKWLAYWTKRKNETLETYWFPADMATLAMIDSLNLQPWTKQLVNTFLHNHFHNALHDWLPLEVLIIHFADMNIWKEGYLHRRQRCKKLWKRHMRNKWYSQSKANKVVQELMTACSTVEKKLLSYWRDAKHRDKQLIEDQAELLRSFKIS